MTKGGPSCSVVIATHNRAEKLRNLLLSLQECGGDLIASTIVVDDSDHPEDLSHEFKDLNLRHILLERRVFFTKAKNIGWREATEDFVYFIDDDNCVTRETLEAPLRTMALSPDIGALMPAVLYKARPDIVWVYATPLDPKGWGHTLVGRNRPRDPGLEGKLLDTDALPNAAILRRRALVDIGGFNEAMAASSSADAALRLKRRGWRVLAHTGAFTFHDVEPPGRAGYWAEHGMADPERVYHDARDWFLLMRSLHPDQRLFPLRATAHAMGFMLPNGLSYFLRGGPRGRRALHQLLRGYLSGVRATVHARGG